jgi:hypothetical protein
MTMISLEGFDNCVAGIAFGAGESDRLVYDVAKIYAHLQYEMDLTFDESIKFFDHNILPLVMGPGSPLFVTFADMDEIREVHCNV